MSLRVATINIEGGKNRERVARFVEEHQPDVVCMQEAYEAYLNWFSVHLQMPYSVFAGNGDFQFPVGFLEVRGLWGNAIFSRVPFRHSAVHTYSGPENTVPVMQVQQPNSGRRTVQVVEVEQGAERYRLANTHLTWTPNGSVTEEQLTAARKMLQYLAQYDDLILVGDFNAPRGKATFQLLADTYTDNIPPEVTSSLDPELHRAGPLPFLVDGVFTSAKYRVEHISFHTGISDHKAILFDIKAIN